MEKYESVIAQAALEMNPSLIANYLFTLAQSFNSFVTELRILTAETAEKKRIAITTCANDRERYKIRYGIVGNPGS